MFNDICHCMKQFYADNYQFCRHNYVMRDGASQLYKQLMMAFWTFFVVLMIVTSLLSGYFIWHSGLNIIDMLKRQPKVVN